MYNSWTGWILNIADAGSTSLFLLFTLTLKSGQGAVLDFSKKVTCTYACNSKKLYAHNLVYMHMMSMMKYMHKIYVLQVVVIPRDIPATCSISSLRRAPLMSQVMPHHLHCKIGTPHFHLAEAEQIQLYFYLHSSSFSTTFSFSLSLLDTRLKCYFLSYVVYIG